MPQGFYLGQRLSYDGEPCTVRYHGPVKGTNGLWLGVEWDDPSRGKHDGKHKERRYFDCVSKEPTAASFIRDSKPSDPPIHFLTAMTRKYGSKDTDGIMPHSEIVVISGKEIDEVGFDLISKKQSAWPGLKIISLDALRLNGICPEPRSRKDRQRVREQILNLNFQCEELDLSRNLFESWTDVVDICSALPKLQILKLNSNRFNHLRSETEKTTVVLDKLQTLSLANTALDWDTVSLADLLMIPFTLPDNGSPLKISILCTHHRFPALRTLSLAFNPLANPSTPPANLLLPSLTRLDLTSCAIAALQPLAFLTNLPNLHTLILRSNPLTTLSTNPQLIFPVLTTLDLTATHLATTTFSLASIPQTFPLLTSLQTSRTPLSTSHPSSRLLTIARLPQLHTLNNTTIPAPERLNAEIYYLKLINRLLLGAERDPAQESRIRAEHPLYANLHAKYGEPSLSSSSSSSSSSSPASQQQQQQPNPLSPLPPPHHHHHQEPQTPLNPAQGQGRARVRVERR
ncbi:MAG: hypothetical protein Q9219_004640 [cf. Caloplaca sp. 3 TL-2023]